MNEVGFSVVGNYEDRNLVLLYGVILLLLYVSYVNGATQRNELFVDLFIRIVRRFTYRIV